MIQSVVWSAGCPIYVFCFFTMGRRKTLMIFPMQYVGLPLCAMTGHPGKLMNECVSAWVISSAVIWCTFQSRNIFPHLFCLAVYEKNQCVILLVSYDSKRLPIILIRHCKRCIGFGLSFPYI